MDPIGFGFEHFDAAGLWRDTEAGKPIDATGEVTHTSDADGTFDGALELASKLSKSTQVQACAVSRSFASATDEENPTAINARSSDSAPHSPRTAATSASS